MCFWQKTISVIFLTHVLMLANTYAEQTSVLRTVIGNLSVVKHNQGTTENLNLRNLFEKDIQFIVLLQRDISCPIGLRTTPYIQDILKKKRKGIQFFLINYQGANQEPHIVKDIQENHFESTSYLADTSQELARALNINTSTEMIVLDRNFEIRYRGPINNRFTLGATKQKYTPLLPTYLAKLQENKKTPAEEHPAPGCFLQLDSPLSKNAEAGSKISWDEIKPLLVQKCIACHRTQELNGIALNTLADFKKNARLAQFVIEKKLMPPVDMYESSLPMVVNYSLSEAERIKLVSWLRNIPNFQNESAPIDDSPAMKPSANEYDYKMNLVENLDVPSKGLSYYKFYYIKSPFPTDKFITASKVEIDNLKSAHHINIRIIKSLPVGKQDPFSLEINHLGGYAPGISGFEIPDDTSVLLPKDSYIFVVAHFTPYGQPHKNSVRLNLKFTEDAQRKKKIFKSTTIMRRDLKILKNTKAKYEKEYIIPANIKLYSLLPHLHFRGEKVKVWLQRKDHLKKTMILGLNTYYFHNQINYNLITPLKLNAGDKILIEYDYNNTSDNIFNPDPSVNINSGPASTDEMFYLALRWIEAED